MSIRLTCHPRCILSVVLWMVLGATPGCVFDRSGFAGPDDGGQNNNLPSDAEIVDGAVWLDAQSDGQVDAQPDVYVPPCSGDTWECLADGTARVCQDDAWVSVGTCPLGCDVGARECRVPSNVPADLMDEGTEALSLSTADSIVTINTDTGAIGGSSGPIRAPGVGLDPTSGIYYERQPQTSGPEVGIFVVQGLTIDTSVIVNVEGVRSLVLLVEGAATINGVINVSARRNLRGPGGYIGGGAAQRGDGTCGGLPGNGEQVSHGCISGGGGGGHAGAGGAGGNSNCGAGYTGGVGGAGTCGVAELVPLVGGSGGAGGVPIPNVTSNPGAGGGGGGAIQVSASGGVMVGASGGINAGGGGGTGCTSSGGSGGGSGGAILVEGPTVSVQGGGILAANGGGGGGGDCT
jgi:hypothetical protein